VTKPVSRSGYIGPPRKDRDGRTGRRIRWFDSTGKRASEVVYGDAQAAQRRLDLRLREAEEERVGLRIRPAAAQPVLEAVALRADAEALPLTQRPRQRARTLTIIDQHWAALTSVPVDRITTADVRAGVARMRAAGRTAASCNRAVSALSVVLQAALEWKMIPANPCRGVRLTEGRKAPRYLSLEEAPRVLAAADGRWRVYFGLALYGGLRLSEASALRWRDIDLVSRRITVRRSRDGADPKSGHHRVLPLHPELAELLGAPGPADHLVVPGSPRRGRREIDPTRDQVVAPRKALLRALRAAGVERHLSYHDLRHTFATLLVVRGADVRTVQELMGHSTLVMTMRYVHAAGDLDEAVRRLDFKGASGELPDS